MVRLVQALRAAHRRCSCGLSFFLLQSSMFLSALASKAEVDAAIRDTVDKVVVLRFGRQDDPTCLAMDDIVRWRLQPQLPSL